VGHDFHIDWLEAALIAHSMPVGSIFPEPELGRNLNRNQEDIDLLIAWESDGATIVVMVEAKGVTAWSNQQYRSKLTRLVGLFGTQGDRWRNVSPRFALASPSPPKRVASVGVTSWSHDANGLPRWLPLRLPEELTRLERCDASGSPSRSGAHSRIIPRWSGRSTDRST
jgi:hypothetical protein